MNIVGVDLGGTNIKAALVDESGEISMQKTTKTFANEGTEMICDRIIELIKDLAQNEVVKVGIGSPGSIDRENGVIKYANNITALNGVKIVQKIKEKTGFDAYLENDAKAAALGEKWFGSAKNTENFIVLTLGTGVGGGAYTEGHLIVGGHGFGGEIGHMIVDPSGPVCSCGSKGCLETFSSVTGMREWVKIFKERYPDSLVFKHSENGFIDAKAIFDAYKEGDRLATLVVRKFNWGLGIGIGSLVNIFNPDLIILSGGISRANDIFLEEVKQVAHEHTYPSLSHSYDIIISELKEKGAILGAASVALERTK
ncbi:MAG TPA: ROK family protein [Thermotogota bacterium]|nr:ROK family protein [Thermotogota bacterium]